MNENIVSTLRALRDVQGIEGSFVCNESGSPLALELPPIFTPELIGEASPRIARLGETFESAGVDFETCVLRFGDFMVYVRRLLKGFLCVITQGTVNSPALKMAVNLAQRRLSAELRALPADAVSGAAPAPNAQPAPQPEAAPSAGRRRVRMYRGQIVEE